MLALPRSVQVWAYPAPTDLRKGYNGLYALVQHGLERDPRSGELFVFVNRNRTLCKVLMCWVCLVGGGMAQGYVFS